jgi:hypothetical protein
MKRFVNGESTLQPQYFKTSVMAKQLRTKHYSNVLNCMGARLRFT